MPGGCLHWEPSRMPYRVTCAIPGSLSTYRAFIAASAPNYAVRSMDSCLSLLKRWSRRNIPGGWLRVKNSRSTTKIREFRKQQRGENMAAIPDPDIAHSHDHHPSGLM